MSRAQAEVNRQQQTDRETVLRVDTPILFPHSVVHKLRVPEQNGEDTARMVKDTDSGSRIDQICSSMRESSVGSACMLLHSGIWECLKIGEHKTVVSLGFSIKVRFPQQKTPQFEMPGARQRPGSEDQAERGGALSNLRMS